VAVEATLHDDIGRSKATEGDRVPAVIYHPQEAPVIDRLTTAEAAKALRVTTRTMQRWRREGVGPAYLRMEGRIYYTTEFLDAYIESLKVAR
jgi:hypothetical protein